MNIVLMGYMGCGKSTVGRVLSKNLSMDYLDLDVFIEKKEGMKISEIFKQKGEIYFRKMEVECLGACLTTKKNTILSLGGGAPCFGNNIEVVTSTEDTLSIYLKTSLEVLVERLMPERAKRPLIAHLETREVLGDFIRKHIFERSFYYSQANAVVNTDEKSAQQIVKEITGLLSK